MAEALLSGDVEKFARVLRDQQKEREEREVEKIRMLNADPFDPDVQAKIAEEIRLRNVESNMETAMEYAPESFGQVSFVLCRLCLVLHSLSFSHEVSQHYNGVTQTSVGRFVRPAFGVLDIAYS